MGPRPAAANPFWQPTLRDRPHPGNNPPVLPASGERRGEAWLVLSALAFSAMSVQVKLAGRELPVAMLVLARGVVTLAMSVAWLSARRIRPWGTDKRGLVQRALFGTAALGCYFYAVTALPLAEATVLHYLNPILVALIAAVFLGEKVYARLVAAISLSLLGTILVARPGFLFGGATTLNHLGIAAALGSAFFSACAYATVRRLARTEHSDVIVFYFAMFAAPIALPFAIATWVWPSPRGWLLMLGLGAATQLGQSFMTRGLALVPAARGTTIGYVQIVFAATLGLVFFGEKLSPLTLAGAGLVVVAVLLLLSGRSAGEPR